MMSPESRPTKPTGALGLDFIAGGISRACIAALETVARPGIENPDGSILRSDGSSDESKLLRPDVVSPAVFTFEASVPSTIGAAERDRSRGRRSQAADFRDLAGDRREIPPNSMLSSELPACAAVLDAAPPAVVYEFPAPAAALIADEPTPLIRFMIWLRKPVSPAFEASAVSMATPLVCSAV